MTIKELGRHFKVQPLDGYYLLYDLNLAGRRTTSKYVGQVFKQKDKFYVNGFEPTNNIDVLKSQLLEYERSLGFDIEYFYPLYREGVTEEYIVHDYLLSRGFKASESGRSYYLAIGNSFNQTKNFYIAFDGLDAHEMKPTVTMNVLIVDFKWVEMKCERNASKIIQMIDNYLVIFGLNLAANGVSLIPNTFTDFDVQLNSFSTDTSTVSKTEFKQELINKLKQTISILESNNE